MIASSKGHLSPQVLADLPIAQAGHGRQLPGVTGGIQAAHLIKQPGCHHLIHARIDARVKLRPGSGDADLQDIKGRRVLALKLGDGLPRHQAHLERPDHAADVAIIDASRRGRVERRQPAVQRFSPLRAGLRFELRPQLRVRRDRRDAPTLNHCLDVLPRAAYQERQPPAGLDVGDGSVRQSLILSQGQHLVGRHDIQQVVRHTGAFCGCDLGRADVHAAVDLAGVGRHDLAAGRLSQIDAQGGFAGRGRAHDDDQGRRTKDGGR